MDAFGRHELLDRIWVIQRMWDSFVIKHIAISKNEIGRADEIADLIAELYQKVGQNNDE